MPFGRLATPGVIYSGSVAEGTLVTDRFGGAIRRSRAALLCLVILIAMVAAGFVPYTSTKSYTWTSEAIVGPGYPGPTTADHMPIVSAVVTGDCSGLFRHDSEYGARPLVRYTDRHLGSSAPLLPTNPCVIGKTQVCATSSSRSSR